MILYCDTSALVRLYVAEERGEAVRRAADAATVLAVCRIAWVEAMAALARRAREQPEDGAVLEVAMTRFARDWASFFVVEIDQALVESAGELADTFALRAYDSVQLAAAHTLSRAAPGEVQFACFDQRLNKAAKALGIDVARTGL